MCVYMCVSGETDRTNTWLHWPNRLNYLAFGSLQPWTYQLVQARRKKTLISDPSPVQCWLIWAQSRALNHWSRLPPKQLQICRDSLNSHITEPNRFLSPELTCVVAQLNVLVERNDSLSVIRQGRSMKSIAGGILNYNVIGNMKCSSAPKKF